MTMQESAISFTEQKAPTMVACECWYLSDFPEGFSESRIKR